MQLLTPATYLAHAPTSYVHVHNMPAELQLNHIMKILEHNNYEDVKTAAIYWCILCLWWVFCIVIEGNEHKQISIEHCNTNLFVLVYSSQMDDDLSLNFLLSYLRNQMMYHHILVFDSSIDT